MGKQLSFFGEFERSMQTHRFDGATFDQEIDGDRLDTQLRRVASLMADGEWRTLAEIATAVQGSEAGVSARLRDLRKARFGGHRVERQRLDGGLWLYRLAGLDQ